MAKTKKTEKTEAKATPEPDAGDALQDDLADLKAEKEAGKIAKADERDKVIAVKDQEIGRLTNQLKEQGDELQKAHRRLAEMEDRLGSMRMAAGAVESMGFDDVREAIAEDGQFAFQVAQDFNFLGSTMKRGRVMKAHHYPQILDYVKAGLRLIPAGR